MNPVEIKNFKEKLDTIGMKAFTDIFIEAHENEKEVLGPDEFFARQPEHIEKAFLEVYYRELREFNLKVIKECFPTMETESFARVFSALGESVPQKLIQQKLDEAIAQKK